MTKPYKAISRVKRNPWLDGISKVLDSQPEPVSVADMLERGDNPYLAGLSDETLYKAAEKNKRQQRTQKRPAKPVARFENDYSVAMIPKKSGKETPLTIEPELLALIKKIITAGGNLPRTQLRNGKSDTYQPEKLLMSKAAKALIKAKLLGTNKSGRITVFWAKQRAA